MKKNNSGRFFAATSALAVISTTLIPTVASAAQFSDIQGNSHEKAILELVEMGLVSGYPDGTFKPNKGLTNSDVVKFMGRYLIENGFEIPSDYKSKMRFSDLSPSSDETLLKFAALVADIGIIPKDRPLEPKQLMTREEMAVILVNTLSTIHQYDFTTFVEDQSFKAEVDDVAQASPNAQSAIRVLDYYDLTSVEKFQPKATLTRGQFASFLYQSTFVKAPDNTSNEPEPQPHSPETPTTNGKFDSYLVKGDRLLYVDFSTDASVQDEADIEVYGVRGDLEIEIHNTNAELYSITTNSPYVDITNNRISANVEAIKNANILEDNDDRYDVGITITINETGETIPYTLTLTREEGTVGNSKFELIDRKSISEKLLADIDIDVTDVADVTSGDSLLVAAELFDELLEEGYFEIEDQFGNDLSLTNASTGTVRFNDGSTETIRLTISNIDSKNDTSVITANGTNRVSVKIGEEGLSVGDSFDLTLTLDNATQTVRVYLH